MGFWVYRSNRVERLAQELARVVRAPLAGALARECIVVQGPGMERWLTAQLAEALGIWANPWFPFPRTAVELILDAALGPAPPEAQLFQPSVLRFRIAQALPGLLSEPSFEDVARYLAPDRAGDRLLALSAQLATTFDQLLLYRTDWVLRWEQGQDHHFQAVLWRALSQGHTQAHLAQRLHAFEQAFRRGSPLRAGAELPPRISLFGLSTLPPSLLGVLARSAELLDVHLFLLAPARDYWGELDRAVRHENDVTGLLASLGKLHREFVDLLADIPYQEPEADLFEPPPCDTLLHGLQADIAALQTRSPQAAGEQAPLLLYPGDDSIRIHACHSPMRELEVLRDELIDRLERDPTLAPHQIAVLTPDIERYAAAIEAVFSDSGAPGRPALPFRVADRKAASISEVAAGFIALLELVRSRLGLSRVLDLLHRTPVRTRFAIEEDELDRIQHWLVEAGARWSIDAQHRQSFDQPGYHEHSLRFALDRLLLGYAGRSGESRAFEGVLGHDDVEGREADLLGRLARFCESLFEATRQLAAPRPVARWADDLQPLLERMLSAQDAFGLQQRMLAALLRDLGSQAEQAGFGATVSLAVIQELLEGQLGQKQAGAGFLSGGITFCEHVPMRAIPFRVLCLLGMDDESFPRTTQRPAFDLLADRPRLGDRSPRDDDRQLFLETLLSARDAWIVTYVGRSAKDDSLRPAAAVVDQVLRVLDQHFVLAAAHGTLELGFSGPPSQQIRWQHALHGFDARYFEPTRSPWFSYNQHALRAARARTGTAQRVPRFASQPLPAPDGEHASVSLDALVRFYRHPQRSYLQERLSVYLPRELDPIEDREPIKLDALASYGIRQQLLERLGALPEAEQYRLLRQAGQLPPGSPGRVQLAEMAELARAIRGAANAGAPCPERRVDITLAGTRLVGQLDHLYEQARVECIAAIPRTKHLLITWIRHLALCASGAAPTRSLLVGRDKDSVKVCAFAPVADPLALLSDLVALYRLGLCMPLPYLHDASEAYVRALEKSGDEAEALRAAQATCAGGKGRAANLPPAEIEDPYVQQVWCAEERERLPWLRARSDALDLDFGDVAARILVPMRQHLGGT